MKLIFAIACTAAALMAASAAPVGWYPKQEVAAGNQDHEVQETATPAAPESKQAKEDDKKQSKDSWVATPKPAPATAPATTPKPAPATAPKPAPATAPKPAPATAPEGKQAKEAKETKVTKKDNGSKEAKKDNGSKDAEQGKQGEGATAPKTAAATAPEAEEAEEDDGTKDAELSNAWGVGRGRLGNWAKSGKKVNQGTPVPAAKPAKEGNQATPAAKPAKEGNQGTPAAKPAKEGKATPAAKPAKEGKATPAAKPAKEGNQGTPVPAAKPVKEGNQATPAAKPAKEGNQATPAAKPAEEGNQGTPAAKPTTKPAEKKKGGGGGIDPTTGLVLLPLPEVSGFCASTNQKPADGTQIKEGSCSSVPQGSIPSTDKMVSTIITSPKFGEKIGAGAGFKVTIQNRNIQTGFFDDPQSEYYTQPQTLNQDGIILGHQHITIQNLGNGEEAPDANQKDFFKGLNDAADGNGKLSVDVPAGTLTKAGTYRICSITGTFSHQPVIMPVAQRGSQDDCIRIEVGN